ncbi:hypothetical protein VYU27_006684 [Nannochloropsis oceanica]
MVPLITAAWGLSTSTARHRSIGQGMINTLASQGTALFATGSSSSTTIPTTWEEQGIAGFVPPPQAVVALLGRMGPGGFGGTGLKFEEVLQAMETYYEYTPKPFVNGDAFSPPGTNVGSCKLLSLGILHGLPPASLLALFGEHYRSVIQTPKGSDHINIRNLLSKGWRAVSFPEGLSLRLKE